MLSAVQNYNVSPKHLAFKGKDENTDTNTNQVKQSNAGLKTGAVWAGIMTPVAAGTNYFLSKCAAAGQNATNLGLDSHQAQQYMTNMKKLAANVKTGWATIPLNIALALGCGALVDKLNNAKRAEFAEKLTQNGKEEMLKNDDNAETTAAGNVYCKSGAGKKWGALLGLGAAILPDLVTMPFSKVKGFKADKVYKSGIISGLAGKTVAGVLGGLALGAIADHFSNKTAEKNADKQAVAE